VLIFALEEHCLATLLRRPEFLERIDTLLGSLSLSPLQEDDFERVENRTLFAAWLQSEEGQDWQEWTDNLPQKLQSHLDFLLVQGLDAGELAGRGAERDIERRALELRRKSVERVIQNLEILQTDAFEQGDAKATEYSPKMIALTVARSRLEHALFERTTMGKREERERVP